MTSVSSNSNNNEISGTSLKRRRLNDGKLQATECKSNGNVSELFLDLLLKHSAEELFEIDACNMLSSVQLLAIRKKLIDLQKDFRYILDENRNKLPLNEILKANLVCDCAQFHDDYEHQMIIAHEYNARFHFVDKSFTFVMDINEGDGSTDGTLKMGEIWNATMNSLNLNLLAVAEWWNYIKHDTNVQIEISEQSVKKNKKILIEFAHKFITICFQKMQVKSGKECSWNENSGSDTMVDFEELWKKKTLIFAKNLPELV